MTIHMSSGRSDLSLPFIDDKDFYEGGEMIIETMNFERNSN